MSFAGFTLCHASVNAKSFRLCVSALVALGSVAGTSIAQAPSSGPLILLLPAGARATAVGGAWVAGRDEDVVFYNPAQIAARTGFNLSLARYGSTATQGSMASGFAAGPWSLALGWGVRVAGLHAPADYVYPLTPDAMSAGGPVDVFSMQAVVGASILFKGFRVGVAGKYATDRASTLGDGSVNSTLTHEAYLADAGIARNMLSGTVALAVQNIGNGPSDGTREIDAPLQASLGWSSVNWSPGEFDLGVYSQVTARTGWIAPALGAELNYGWIEGFSIAARAGVRRPETDAEKPFVIGAAFTGDHLVVDFAHQFFDGGHHANRVTIRWR